jgi:hypothetical protein
MYKPGAAGFANQSRLFLTFFMWLFPLSCGFRKNEKPENAPTIPQ